MPLNLIELLDKNNGSRIRPSLSNFWLKMQSMSDKVTEEGTANYKKRLFECMCLFFKSKAVSYIRNAKGIVVTCNIVGKFSTFSKIVFYVEWSKNKSKPGP